MNNYPTSDLKSGEYETRQSKKRICKKCINAKKTGKYWFECKISKKAVKRNDTCKYFIPDIE